MPGGTLHWVLGTSNAVCSGRHFYGASTIRNSVVAIVHTFFLSGALTNEDHLETRTLLYQLMVFWSMRMNQRDIDGNFEQFSIQFRSNQSQVLIYRTCPPLWNFLM